MEELTEVSICLPSVLLSTFSAIDVCRIFARVKSLSLTAKLLRLVVDRFIVQWPEAGRGKMSTRDGLYDRLSHSGSSLEEFNVENSACK